MLNIHTHFKNSFLFLIYYEKRKIFLILDKILSLEQILILIQVLRKFQDNNFEECLEKLQKY